MLPLLPHTHTHTKDTLGFYAGFETKPPKSLKAQGPIRKGMILIWKGRQGKMFSASTIDQRVPYQFILGGGGYCTKQNLGAATFCFALIARTTVSILLELFSLFKQSFLVRRRVGALITAERKLCSELHTHGIMHKVCTEYAHRDRQTVMVEL